MKTPDFWKTRSRLVYLLLPFSMLYEMIYMLRRAFTVQVKLTAPVVCIGNVTAGGAGKTPVALAIGKRLKERGLNAFYISRGYGGNILGPVLVDPIKHHSYEVGDEPLLLAEMLPTVVGKDRIAAAHYAIKKGAKLLVFDDGFQNKKIYKDFSLLVVDGAYGFGNGMLLPAGPLRERPEIAFSRAHSIIVMNPKNTLPPLPEGKPVLIARTTVVGLAEKLERQRIVAFCGIALPEKFKATLVALKANLIHFASFADHQFYRNAMLLPLAEMAFKEKAFLVTTRKDYVRLPRSFKDKVVVVDIDLIFDDEAAIAAHIEHIVQLSVT